VRTLPDVAATDAVDSFLAAFPGDSRRLAEGEWGLTVPADQAGGWPLELGLRIADGMLRAQAPAVEFDEAIDPWMLLWWNRQTRYVRFACTRSREIWVHGDIPASAVDERSLDRLLGLVVEGALNVRDYAARSRSLKAR
jgi:Putative bacterial sensory transduction regulator